MEKYHLLYLMGKKPELRIIKDESLTKFRRENPNLETVSFGDFYTEVPLVKFPKVIYNSFDEDREKIKILPTSKYNPNIHNKESNLYLIRENDGIRLKYPMAWPQKVMTGFEYQLLSIIATQELLSDKKEGSFQKYLDSIISNSNRNNTSQKEFQKIIKEIEIETPIQITERKFDVKTLELELAKQRNQQLEDSYDGLLRELTYNGRYN